MILFNLIIGCAGLILSGNAFARFSYTKNKQWITTGILEALIGIYFVIAAIGTATQH